MTYNIQQYEAFSLYMLKCYAGLPKEFGIVLPLGVTYYIYGT